MTWMRNSGLVSSPSAAQSYHLLARHLANCNSAFHTNFIPINRLHFLFFFIWLLEQALKWQVDNWGIDKVLIDKVVDLILWCKSGNTENLFCYYQMEKYMFHSDTLYTQKKKVSSFHFKIINLEKLMHLTHLLSLGNEGRKQRLFICLCLEKGTILKQWLVCEVFNLLAL